MLFIYLILDYDGVDLNMYIFHNIKYQCLSFYYML